MYVLLNSGTQCSQNSINLSGATSRLVSIVEQLFCTTEIRWNQTSIEKKHSQKKILQRVHMYDTILNMTMGLASFSYCPPVQNHGRDMVLP